MIDIVAVGNKYDDDDDDEFKSSQTSNDGAVLLLTYVETESCILAHAH